MLYRNSILRPSVIWHLTDIPTSGCQFLGFPLPKLNIWRFLLVSLWHRFELKQQFSVQIQNTYNTAVVWTASLYLWILKYLCTAPLVTSRLRENFMSFLSHSQLLKYTLVNQNRFVTSLRLFNQRNKVAKHGCECLCHLKTIKTYHGYSMLCITESSRKQW